MVIHTAEAKTIHVADHGVIPGQDATLALTRLIHHIDGEKNITLVFPKGTYDFYPENASDQYRAVSNHDNSLKRIIFSLAGNQKLTIDGGGSDFIFHGRVSPFVLNRVDGATLKNFSIDWKRPFQSELKIVERNTDDRSFIVEIDPEKYPYVIKDDRLYFKHYNWEDPFGANIVFDPKTGAPIHDTRKYYIHPNSKIKATAAGKNRVKIESQISTPPPVGTYMIVYGVEPTSRLCPAIDVTHSKDVVIENVQIYAAGGMGIIAERTENIHLNNFNVTTRKGSGRLVSARADATHFIGCKGDILIENCLLEHMLDDSSNVHGAYVRVEKNLGNNQFLCAISHPQQWGLTFAEAGDKVAMLSRETILPFAKTTVKAVKKINEQRIIITLSSTPKNLPNVPMSLENLSWNANFTMRNNTIKENRARSVLITTKGKVLLENNYFSSHMKGILIEGDNHYWYESGAVQDVTIRNNVFNNIGYAGGSRGYALYASPMIRKGQRMGEGRYHRNIHFTGNTVKSFNGQFIFARSVDGLNITGNTFELSKDYPTIDTKPPAIDLHYCDNVTVDQNTINGFESTMNVRISSDTEHTHVSPGQGFVIGE
ncbi:MAG: right-handed parallel beta-helix repeat-containing protein [Verrucomicrobiae bacterium]|nr:right-handed parallel beta-helix repeat-containing protein [Verrucomicrobiae bacterium]NNJ43218.1 right-handed parallel beta-helix repeat-containing protein [Akkermansiaceae bacterium]